MCNIERPISDEARTVRFGNRDWYVGITRPWLAVTEAAEFCVRSISPRAIVTSATAPRCGL